MPKKVELQVGGQAVIEGVMMRSPNYVGTAVRNPSGKIVTKVQRVKKPCRFWRLPFFRGMHSLWTMLVVGIKALNWSASQAGDEGEKISDFALYATITIAFFFGIALFVLLPYALTFLTGVTEESNPVLFNLVDGVIKVAILVAYMYSISMLDDIKRIFQYHGAEHKTVFCHERRKPLSVRNVRGFSTKHPRCGTSFLFIVIIISIFVFSFTPLVAWWLVPSLDGMFWLLKRSILFGMRILFLPIIAGISYEFLKWSARLSGKGVWGFFVLPGLLLQRITTREPSNEQIKVAIESLKIVLRAEGQKI